MTSKWVFTVCNKRGCGFSAAHETENPQYLSRDGRFAIYKCERRHETRIPIKWLKKYYPKGKA